MRTSRRALAELTAALLTVAMLLAACSSSSDEGDGSEESNDSTTSSSAPTTDAGAAPVDQTPPQGANGIKVDGEGDLWIAVIESDEVLRVDAATGEILQRIAAPDGAGPDDLVVADDGTVFWTGFRGGQVGRIDPDTGETTTVAEVGAGANPIALRADGTLVVGRAITATGLYAVDPTRASEPVLLSDPGNVNSFSLSPDGVLYGPLTTPDGSSVIAMDQRTGAVIATLSAVPGFAAAVRWFEGDLYVLAVDQGAANVYRMPSEGGDLELFADTGLALADNLAVGEDGTVYVTGLDQPTVTVIDPAGTVTGTLDIGS